MKDNNKKRTSLTDNTEFSTEDLEKMWQAIDQGDHDAEIAMILCYTGMRPAELLELKKTDVDVDARIIICGTKTESRHIPIHACIVPFVERLLQTDGDLLFMDYDSRIPSTMAYSQFREYLWNPLMKRLGMPQCTPHYGRNTSQKMMQETEINDDIRLSILGLYRGENTHHPDSMLIEAMDKIPGRNGEIVKVDYDRMLHAI